MKWIVFFYILILVQSQKQELVRCVTNGSTCENNINESGEIIKSGCDIITVTSKFIFDETCLIEREEIILIIQNKVELTISNEVKNNYILLLKDGADVNINGTITQNQIKFETPKAKVSLSIFIDFDIFNITQFSFIKFESTGKLTITNSKFTLNELQYLIADKIELYSSSILLKNNDGLQMKSLLLNNSTLAMIPNTELITWSFISTNNSFIYLDDSIFSVIDSFELSDTLFMGLSKCFLDLSSVTLVKLTNTILELGSNSVLLIDQLAEFGISSIVLQSQNHFFTSQISLTDKSNFTLIGNSKFFGTSVVIKKKSHFILDGNITFSDTFALTCYEDSTTTFKGSILPPFTKLEFYNKSAWEIYQDHPYSFIFDTLSTSKSLFKQFGMFDESKLYIHSPPEELSLFHFFLGEVMFDPNVTIHTFSGECFYLATFEIHNNLAMTLKNPHFILLNDNRLYKYCPNHIDPYQHCYMNGTQWPDPLSDDANTPYPFTSRLCPCFGSNCITHSLTGLLYIGNSTIYSTFVDKRVQLHILQTSSYYQFINGSIESIHFDNIGFSILPLYLVGDESMSITNEPTNINDYRIFFSRDYDGLSLSETFLSSTELTTSAYGISSSRLKLIIQSHYPVIIKYDKYNQLLYHKVSDGDLPLYLVCLNGIRNLLQLTSVKLCSSAYLLNNKMSCLTKTSITCPEHYFSNSYFTLCSKCKKEHCQRCTSTTCLICDDNYYLNTEGSCVPMEEKCLVAQHNRCNHCSKGNTVLNGICSDAVTDCSDSFEDHCYLCQQTTSTPVISINGKCFEKESTEIVSSSSIVFCIEGYYTDGLQCISCTIVTPNCQICENKKCTKCLKPLQLQSDGSCGIPHCQIEEDGKCSLCENGYIVDLNKLCSKEVSHCIQMYHEQCFECEENYLLYGNTCVKDINQIPHCSFVSTKICERCEDGYYKTKFGECKPCTEHCRTCLYNSDFCLTCDNKSFIQNHQCIINEELKDVCNTFALTGGCATCNEGYYKTGLICGKCMEECATCNNKWSCLRCNSTNYLSIVDNKCYSRSSIKGCHHPVTENGCSVCEDGYYLLGNTCIVCNSSCTRCTSSLCLSCIDNYILDFGTCIPLSSVSHCLRVSNSSCSSCSFWFQVSSSHRYCEIAPVWWLIVIIILLSITLLIIIITLTGCIARMVLKKVVRAKDISYQTVNIYSAQFSFKNVFYQSLALEEKVFRFDNQRKLPVSVPTEVIINVGNISKNSIRIQFVKLQEPNDHVRFSISITPGVVILKKNTAVSIKMEVTPYCTCHIEQKIHIDVVDLKTKSQVTKLVCFDAVTETSYKLDLKSISFKDKELGIGGYGRVVKGEYNHRPVAIKLMQSIGMHSDVFENFVKEIELLQKFRCEYIVDLLGTVEIHNGYCVVLELAGYGSLRDLFTTYPTLDFNLKKKILLDVAKGIKYLHANGVLHRDMKTANILIFSLEPNVPVNAKITDFGFSRSVSTLMTDINYTFGVGTLTYMAPEIFLKEPYKFPADIFAFGVVIFETIKWGDAFEQNDPRFKCNWHISEFIMSGKHLEKPESMSESVYNFVLTCWDKEPKKRPKINEVEEELLKIEETQ
ncbi:protein serine/threonine kinase, putative [Entamoeba dispar SAW760]|uniref:Protein serine/threonine kinase, putative n=1 Tax=Entamoeba dispar (strain ATCC PRA-260 / SAW760) TaxID=370354 RepID=B0ESS4_ENTDS|nr:protein serine/threonine kinase, putative [Entamoeba dispar SAW760]EDR22420.1 protein serine/threonine kinase, putative [Entamoeba dispar SAW760]|eukprot:EDR22420.1 protein serine/threonine kinase, putative [Entamoeba dispar SAW760]